MIYKNFIESVLKAASSIAVRKFGKVSGVTKVEDSNQVLSEADVEIGNLLVNKIRHSYPNHNIIDEEAGTTDNHSEFTWVVDPIDGTSNFVSGIPMYGVTVGLLKDGFPIVGGIALPSFSEIYFAEKGRGAFCNDAVIKVTSEKELINSLVAYGIDGHQESPQLTQKECSLLAEIVLKSRNLRSSNSAYDFAMVASGKYGAYLNKTSRIWDNVAPQIVIEEAGGVYTDFEGEQIDYSNPLKKAGSNFTYIAASPVLHQQLLKIING